MSKRIKKVFTRFDQIVHLFAHQTQDEARGGRGYFRDNVIYSFGHHFPIARIFTDDAGKKTVFFTTREYSGQTTQHKKSVRSACSHMDLLFMKIVDKSSNPFSDCSYELYEHKENINDFVQKILENLAKFPTARDNKAYLLRTAKEQKELLVKYLEFYKIENLPKSVTEVIESVDAPTWLLEVDSFNKKKEEREKYNQEHFEEIQAKKQAKTLKENKSQIEKWRNFEVVHPYKVGKHYGNYYNKDVYPDLLRYNKSKERIETSQGIEVPIEVARRFYNRIQTTLLTGGCVDNCGDKILDYTVKEITSDYLLVGCHKILQTEIENIAQYLGWNN